MATINVKDAAGSTEAIEKPLAPGRAAAASSRPVALSTEDKASIDAITTKLTADPATQTTLAAINTKTPALGQALAAASVPVILPSATVTTLTPPTTVTANLGTIGTAATAANQTTGNTSLSTIATNTTGAATAANQSTTNTTLSTINGKLTQRAGSSAAVIGDSALVVVNRPDSLADPFAQYEFVAASATTQALGATGATGDYLAGVLIYPATAAAGAVSIKDGSNTAITIFAGGGTTALPTLAPIPVPLGIYSVSGAWQITTGANVSAMGIGKFT
jgi:hypothetical protein